MKSYQIHSIRKILVSEKIDSISMNQTIRNHLATVNNLVTVSTSSHWVVTLSKKDLPLDSHIGAPPLFEWFYQNICCTLRLAGYHSTLARSRNGQCSPEDQCGRSINVFSGFCPLSLELCCRGRNALPFGKYRCMCVGWSYLVAEIDWGSVYGERALVLAQPISACPHVCVQENNSHFDIFGS